MSATTSGTLLAEQHESSQHAYGGTVLWLFNEILKCIKPS